jgi:hypothetical protein
MFFKKKQDFDVEQAQPTQSTTLTNPSSGPPEVSSFRFRMKKTTMEMRISMRSFWIQPAKWERLNIAISNNWKKLVRALETCRYRYLNSNCTRQLSLLG